MCEHLSVLAAPDTRSLNCNDLCEPGCCEGYAKNEFRKPFKLWITAVRNTGASAIDVSATVSPQMVARASCGTTPGA